MPALLLSLAALAGCASAPPPQSVQVGAGRIAYQRVGAGGPVVVFQAGLGDGMDVWSAVLQRLSPATAVFAYDRPGYGRSTGLPATPPRDPCGIARELHATLQAAGVPPPYVLVGHSIGGLYQYAFARLYPDEVAGLLLLDPTHPEHWARLQREAPASARMLTGLRATVFSAAMRAEFDAQGSCTDALRARPATPVPARLLVRSGFGPAEPAAFEALVRRLEAEWPVLLPGATRRQVAGAGHYIQTERPDVVAEELQALMRALPAGQR